MLPNQISQKTNLKAALAAFVASSDTAQKARDAAVAAADKALADAPRTALGLFSASLNSAATSILATLGESYTPDPSLATDMQTAVDGLTKAFAADPKGPGYFDGLSLAVRTAHASAVAALAKK